MKKLLFIITLFAINSATVVNSADFQFPTRLETFVPQRENDAPSPEQVSRFDFRLLMTIDSNYLDKGPQYALDRSWNNWTEHQRQDILLRLWDLGLLSEDDVVYWQGKLGERNNQIPQANFVEIGG